MPTVKRWPVEELLHKLGVLAEPLKLVLVDADARADHSVPGLLTCRIDRSMLQAFSSAQLRLGKALVQNNAYGSGQRHAAKQGSIVYHHSTPLG